MAFIPTCIFRERKELKSNCAIICNFRDKIMSRDSALPEQHYQENQPIKLEDILETQRNCSGNSNNGRVLRILFFYK